MEKDYLIRRRPIAALLIFALPMMLGNFFQQLYTMADSAIVGRLVGEEALAAVGASYSLTNVFISIAIGGGVGASVITGQTFGRRDFSRMKRSVSTALLSFLAISVVLGGMGLALSRQIMVLLRTPANILDDATTYLNIYFLGLPFLFMYNVLSSMFNALGRSRIPLYLLIFSSVLNVVLDPIFMFGWGLGMGVEGASLATTVSQFVTFFILAWFYLSGRAGIAVQPRKADPFQRSPGDLPLNEVQKEGVGGQGCPQLDLPAAFIFSQCPHTPYTD